MRNQINYTILILQKPVPTCSSDARPYRFDQKQIDYILHLHNDFRNAIANGSVSNSVGQFLPAARMVKMTWDPEMGYLAGLNTRSCVFGHDHCHSTSNTNSTD